MEYTRLLKLYSSGADVKYVKDRLVELGYLHKSTHSIFGRDTKKAVIQFQEANELEADGIVGKLTWAALFGTKEEKPVEVPEIPPHISSSKAAAIAKDLAATSEMRRKVCLLAIYYATDPDNPGKSMRCFYIRGGNLFNKDLSLNTMTAPKLNSYFSKSAYAPYFDGGRKEVMLAHADASSHSIPGADCSGMVVGIWRFLKLVSSGFDANANSLFASHCTETSTPTPGDLVWKSGHIGVYVGGGYVAEDIGGAYGLQITKLKDRRCYNYVDKKIHHMSPWEKYGNPKYY